MTTFFRHLYCRNLTHTPLYIRSTISPFSKRITIVLSGSVEQQGRDQTQTQLHSFTAQFHCTQGFWDASCRKQQPLAFFFFFFYSHSFIFLPLNQKTCTVLFTPLTLQQRWCNMTRRWHRNKYWRKASWRKINEASSMQSLYLQRRFPFWMLPIHKFTFLLLLLPAAALSIYSADCTFECNKQRVVNCWDRRKSVLSWIFLFNKAKKICKAGTDWFPACCHAPVSHFDTSAANIPQFISFSDDFWTSYSCLDVQTVLFLLPDTFSLTRWQTDLCTRDKRYCVNEYGWSRPSVHLPLGLADAECWQRSARGWKESENEPDANEALMFSPGEKPSRSRFSRVYTPRKSGIGRRDIWNISFELSVNMRRAAVKIYTWKERERFRWDETERQVHIHIFQLSWSPRRHETGQRGRKIPWTAGLPHRRQKYAQTSRQLAFSTPPDVHVSGCVAGGGAARNPHSDRAD